MSMLKKRSRKFGDKASKRPRAHVGWQRSMLYRYNRPNPRADNLLKKSQYVDF